MSGPAAVAREGGIPDAKGLRAGDPRDMKRNVLSVALVISLLVALGSGMLILSTSTVVRHHTHAPAPVISSDAQLAALIRHHAVQDGGNAGPFKRQVTVTCRAAAPRHKRAFDHVCRETYLDALCIVGSTPEVDVLMVDVLPRGYRTVRTRTVVSEACEMP
jgi:hypothetical protein